MIKLFSPDALKIAINDLRQKRYHVKSNNYHIKKALGWLKVAHLKGGDGGVSAWYSLASGWAPSYIETTGYIISTFLDCSKFFKDNSLLWGALKMGDFLIKMQLANGGFRTEVPKVKKDSIPTIFDTSQDIIGLVDLYNVTKDKRYLESVKKAADFLCQVQENDGSFIKYSFGGFAHTFDSRTAWALLKVYKLTRIKRYKSCALRTLNWVAKNQQKNGWFRKNSLPKPNPKNPFTHIISYAIEGFLWSGLILRNKKYINIAIKGAKPLLNIYLKRDFLPGTLNNNWSSRDNYTCLTGNAQLALVWLKLYELTKDKNYLIGAKKMNNFLKSQQNTQTKNKNICGGIKGSDPIFGDLLHLSGYCRMVYPNWAAKFFIDALIAEELV